MNSIKMLAWQVTEEMREAGYSPTTIWLLYVDSLLPAVKNHETHDAEFFDLDVMAEYVRQVEERRSSGAITRGHRAYLLSGIDKMARLNETGRLEWSLPGKVSKFEFNDYYEQILGEYITYNDLHPNARGDVIWVTRKFFAWLAGNGHDTLERVGASEIQRFMVHCSGYMRSSSVYDVQYMRKLCLYLYEHGLLGNPFSALLSMRVSRESKMYPATPQDELAAVLAQVDCNTARGKRNYAMILLGVVTGLRAVDVARLKLSNVDWIRGEITIVQAKTGKTLVLPLTTDVGEALKDYILHARPRGLADNVFLRNLAPNLPFKDSCSIGNMYDVYRRKAGLAREAFDGKCFHSLRRALGKNMVTAGVSVTDVAQVLGQEDIDSAKKYIALDSEHLKECALGLSGIEVTGGFAQ